MLRFLVTFSLLRSRFWPAERRVFESIWGRVERDGGKAKVWSMDLGGGWMVKRERERLG